MILLHTSKGFMGCWCPGQCLFVSLADVQHIIEVSHARFDNKMFHKGGALSAVQQFGHLAVLETHTLRY